MPSRPKRPCRQPGCPELVVTGYCDTHAKPAAQQRERWRGSASSRGYDSAWQNIREQALKRDRYLCLHCLDNDRVTPAIDVDHIIPFVSLADPLRLDITNLQSLCRPCHRVKTSSTRKG
jgi:5-methylcytosine-specific restriction protein A